MILAQTTGYQAHLWLNQVSVAILRNFSFAKAVVEEWSTHKPAPGARLVRDEKTRSTWMGARAKARLSCQRTTGREAP